jgi:hypothetical protein
MAASYITNIQITARQNLPGGGQNTTGVPQQGKVWVVGYMAGTYQANANDGTFLSPSALGLDTVDVISFEVESTNATPPSATNILGCQWKRSTNQLYMYSVVHSGTETTNGHAFVIRFVAFGDTAATTELL